VLCCHAGLDPGSSIVDVPAVLTPLGSGSRAVPGPGMTYKGVTPDSIRHPVSLDLAGLRLFSLAT
jgi:hypothetical protein